MHACLQAGKLMRYTQKMFSNYRNQHEPQLVVWALARKCNVANAEAWHPASAHRCSERHRARPRLNRYPFGRGCPIVPSVMRTNLSQHSFFWQTFLMLSARIKSRSRSKTCKMTRKSTACQAARRHMTHNEDMRVLRSIGLGSAYLAPPRLLS